MLTNREAVLSRLFAILNTVTSPAQPATVARNRGLLDNDMRPALVMLDGDERNVLPSGGRGRPRMSPGLIAMTPQVFIVLKIKKPQNEGVGELLNEYRTSVIRAIADDTELLTLLGPNGGLTYDGCETDLKTGMVVEGQMQLNFTLTTVLDPYKP